MIDYEREMTEIQAADRDCIMVSLALRVHKGKLDYEAWAYFEKTRETLTANGQNAADVVAALRLRMKEERPVHWTPDLVAQTIGAARMQ